MENVVDWVEDANMTKYEIYIIISYRRIIERLVWKMIQVIATMNTELNCIIKKI